MHRAIAIPTSLSILISLSHSEIRSTTWPSDEVFISVLVQRLLEPN